ncbi:siderophore-interacting protein [Hydrocarboniphaga sp.]|uniref:siderophore-interacting protein n=1 Tax=Hydrocarboniphaga sp. TaxID=2033016 RepID=UPI003D0C1E78
MSTSRNLIESAALGLLTRSARVADVQVLGEHYRRIRLEGENLCGRDWTPGDTVRLMLPGWHKRCYTPSQWDGERGQVDFVAYLHGDGPASLWAATVEAGDDCQIRGPRGAIDLRTVAAPAVLFGDETSLSTAMALRDIDARARIVLEVASVAETQLALRALGIGDAMLLQREADERQLDDCAQRLIAALQANAEAGAALTGRAPAIQRLYKALRRAGIPQRRIRNHAYWAPGKKGLE